MAQSFEGELAPLHDALERAVLPVFRGGAVDESPWPTEPTGPAHAPNFWQLTKPGQQVLADARTQGAQPETGAHPRISTAQPQQQNEHGL